MGQSEIITAVVTLIGAIGIPKIWPIISEKIKSKSEENKLKLKLSSDSADKVADIWKKQYEEAKEELKIVIEHKIALEVKVATLKERLSRYAKTHGTVLSVKPKGEDDTE